MSKRATFLGILLLLAFGAASLGLASGAADISPARAIGLLVERLGGTVASDGDQAAAIVMEIRLPRVLLGLLVGSALAASGALTQALFRNPLAEPGLIGVQAGAALGAALTIVLGGFASLGIASGGFALGLATTTAVFLLARRQGQTMLTTLLLAGIAVNALVGAATGLLTYAADDDQLRSLTFWTLGSLGGATWESVAASAALIVPFLIALPLFARPLNALALGEAQAMHLGVPVERVKACGIVLVALAVGAAVAAAGMIGFVGLVVPHVLRMLVGPDHRWIVPGSAILGGALLVLADVAARTAVAPAELPIGILTAAVGGPFFLWLLLRERGRVAAW